MAHGDFALEAAGLGALGDRRDLSQSAFAAVVQMDVDAHAAPLGDGEDRVEMAIEVAVDADGIEAAQKVGAFGDGGIEQRGRARRAQDAALREGDDLDGHQVAEALADLQDLVEVLETELVVDVDVAPHVQRAAGHDLSNQIGAGLRFGNGARRAYPALGLDAVGDAIARRLVGHPGQAKQRLVEMDMAVDQRRQEQRPFEIEVARIRGREEGGDPPSRNLDVVLAAVGQRGVGEPHALTCLRWRPLPCGSARPRRGRPWPSGRSRWRW
jgi:hypothetical protein